MDIYTLPPRPYLTDYIQKLPAYMRPNMVPYGIVFENALNKDQCEQIMDDCIREEAYTLPSCGAETRELTPRPALDPLYNLALFANDMYFQYDLDPNYMAWMQTYHMGDKYELHSDTVPGQMRKLTAVAMINNDHMYEGGQLWLKPPPLNWAIPKTRGTVVVFQPWIPHVVEPITNGLRRTINLGIWGPPFK